MLLRVAVGWHFLTEGMAKVDPPPGKEFNAEGYFRVATGPLGPYFRGMIPDTNGLERLRRDEAGLPAGLKDQWKTELDQYVAHFGFDANQKAEAEKAYSDTALVADNWFRNPENQWKVRRYMADLRRVILTERDPRALESQRELAYKDRQRLNKERVELLATAAGWTNPLHEKWAGLATESQLAQVGAYQAPWTTFDWLNWLTKWGLVVAGACLILGLLTPLAALWAAGFLALIYLSVPPWPGLPASPVAEGNYWIVNKNLVEMFACLVLASTPNGLWLGIDALLFGWMHRRRIARELAENNPPVSDDGNDGNGRRPSSDPRRPVSVTRRSS